MSAAVPQHHESTATETLPAHRPSDQVDGEDDDEKCPPYKWVPGSHQLRKMTPFSFLPDVLDPKYVDGNPADIPLLWCGLPLRIDEIHHYAEKVGLVVPAQILGRPLVGRFDYSRTAERVEDHILQNIDLEYSERQVWNAPEGFVIAFFNNRNMDTNFPEDFKDKLAMLNENLGHD